MTSIAKCSHCGASDTRLTEIEPHGATKKQTVICCGSCSTILGTPAQIDDGSVLERLEKRLAEMEKQIGELIYQVQHLSDVFLSRKSRAQLKQMRPLPPRGDVLDSRIVSARVEDCSGCHQSTLKIEPTPVNWFAERPISCLPGAKTKVIAKRRVYFQ